MVEKDDKKHLISLVPAILTGAAALIAALPTAYVNLRGNDKPSDAAKPQAVASAQLVPAQTVPAKPAVVSGPQQIRLQVERIAVHSDGTVGSTDWRFSVEVDDEPRFAFEQDGLTDEGGRNIAMPQDAFTALQLRQDKPMKVVIKGWKQSRLHGPSPVPDAIGEGRLTPDGKAEPLPVNAASPDLGAFTFYFTVMPGKG